MDAREVADRLARNVEHLLGLLAGVSEEQARWRPAPGRWSLLELVNHLADEERHDFRARLASTLADPATPWPGIDPEGWVSERDYASRGWAASLADLAAERAASVTWLAGLEAPDWSATHAHPHLGALRAGDLLTSWEVHDYLHLRQVARLLHDWCLRGAAPYDGAYAGGW